jgi:predicted transcriptional regulator
LTKFYLGKYRDRLCIVAAVLEATNSGSTKTKIMFAANLSFTLLEKYLDIVVSAGFVEVNDSVYLLTESGQEFLKRYRVFHEQYAKAQEQIEALGSEYEELSQLCDKRMLRSFA